MSRKIYRAFIVVLLLSLFIASCAPDETIVQTPDLTALETAVNETTEEQEQPSTPGIPQTGGNATVVAETPVIPSVIPPEASTISPQLPVTGDDFNNLDRYEDYYGLPVYDLGDNWLGTLEHVVLGPEGLSDFALVATWENLYRPLPVSAMTVDEASDSLIFKGELDQFMGSPTFETVSGLNFDVDSVRNAVIGYWQHQVDIEAPRP